LSQYSIAEVMRRAAATRHEALSDADAGGVYHRRNKTQ
jgi:hypothetical protein